MHAARKVFKESEASEKLRCALKGKVRPCTSITYELGQLVYYKRRDSNKWKGPGTVTEKDNHQVLVKHGGVYVRVHPCSLRPVQIMPEQKCFFRERKGE